MFTVTHIQTVLRANSVQTLSIKFASKMYVYRILNHFNTDLNEYSVIFTSGATAALKLVADSFCWSDIIDSDEWQPKEFSNDCGDFVYMEDNHTSVLGMREVVTGNGAKIHCLPHSTATDTFSNGTSYTNFNRFKSNSLFVYSAQCNFSGVKYPLDWIEKVHQNILEGTTGKRSNWYCMLDAATYVSTNKLDLGKYKPDFICISFYKLFGYPTGLGALLVKNTSANVLYKKYYGGGTVLIALSCQSRHVPKPVIHERFEDGTLNFLSILSLNHGFSSLYDMVGSMDTVSRYCFNLAKYAFNSLLKLHHSNGNPAVHLYTDSAYDDITTQGNIVNFNLLRANGDYIGYAEVLNIANLHNIQLRTGCFCNPGACRRHLGLTLTDIKKHYQSGHVCGDDNDLVNGQPTGSVRVSFGYYTTKEDIDYFISVLRKCFVKEPAVFKMPALWTFIASNLKKKFGKSKDKLLPIETIEAMKYIYYWYSDNLTWSPQIDSQQEMVLEEKYNNKSEVYISDIFVYPIKSCGRYKVRKWELDSKGLMYDRQWMITNSYGVALTQKREPRMCLIKPVIDTTLGKLHLTSEGFENVSVDLEYQSVMSTAEASFCQSKVCQDRVQGVDCGDEVANWLSKVLGKQGLRLIRQVPEDTRAHKTNKGELSLVNQAQYLLINKKSVDWLGELLDENSDCPKESMIHRFRCNFVVTGLKNEFEEQEWQQVKIGGTLFNVDGLCSRCQMICINQDTGKKTKEPLTTLSASMQGKLKFGIYLSKVSNTKCVLAVGDSLEIVL
ncbi:molybdenum cofactor sulfurase isoform X2 [Cimex lectularius]|uniref:Molybdenum cofactor sulfurase n=1 Tax=Cimex lectularius TaxID=79782 RepID=A0A8I6SS99_CIMLE|nr:molybdenum cofactor sulfurase isoform X2 [Cimex lectularius]